jgi:hypothetical protein
VAPFHPSLTDKKEHQMNSATHFKNKLKASRQLPERMREIEFLFMYQAYDRIQLIEYLVQDHGFCPDALGDRPLIEIWGELEILQFGYGLSFEYIPAYTFPGETNGYFRYQLAVGGPLEELIFQVCPEHFLIEAQYRFNDHFIDCTDNDTIIELWNHFRNSSRSVYAFQSADQNKLLEE